MDGATQHRIAGVKKYIAENKKNLKVIYLLTATPELNAIENFWGGSKDKVSVSEEYESFEDMKHVLTEHVRTTPINLTS